jgi:hypothetical protein
LITPGVSQGVRTRRQTVWKSLACGLASAAFFNRMVDARAIAVHIEVDQHTAATGGGMCCKPPIHRHHRKSK